MPKERYMQVQINVFYFINNVLCVIVTKISLARVYINSSGSIVVASIMHKVYVVKEVRSTGGNLSGFAFLLYTFYTNRYRSIY